MAVAATVLALPLPGEPRIAPWLLPLLREPKRGAPAATVAVRSLSIAAAKQSRRREAVHSAELPPPRRKDGDIADVAVAPLGPRE